MSKINVSFSYCDASGTGNDCHMSFDPSDRESMKLFMKMCTESLIDDSYAFADNDKKSLPVLETRVVNVVTVDGHDRISKLTSYETIKFASVLCSYLNISFSKALDLIKCADESDNYPFLMTSAGALAEALCNDLNKLQLPYLTFKTDWVNEIPKSASDCVFFCVNR